MKKNILTLSLVVFCSSVFGQQVQTKLLKFKGVKGELGFSWDKYKDMSLDWMKLRTAQEGAFNDDLSSMQESSVFYSSLGASIGGQILFTAPSLGNETFIPEVRFGGTMVFGKEAIVEFTDMQGSPNGINSLMYCFVENESKLSGEIVWRVGDESKVTFYSGIGANLSGSFANDLIVFDDFINSRTVTGNNFESIQFNSAQSSYDGKSVFYQRAYIPVGVDLKMFRHLQGTIEYKIGGGMEQVVGGKISTFKTGEFNFGLRYNIQKNNTPSLLDYL